MITIYTTCSKKKIICVWHRLCVYVYHVILRIMSDYFTKQHFVLHNADVMCALCEIGNEFLDIIYMNFRLDTFKLIHDSKSSIF
jgi:hypothetical protein